jgi:DNA repair photolyase
MQPALFDTPAPATHVGKADIHERRTAKALVPGTGKIKFVDYALNSYVGCGFGCTFCYAQFFVADEEKRAAWGTWVDIKTGVIREVLSHDLRGKKILMSSATDPYQPLEAKACITRNVLEVLSPIHRQPSFVVQTHSPLVTRDIDLLKQYKDLRVNMSITTDDDEIRRQFEPNCASIDRRFAALEELKAAGIRIGVSISPLLPIADPVAFAKRINKLDPERAFASVFHQTEVAFAANTPEQVVAKARAMGWTQKAEAAALTELRSRVPAFWAAPESSRR